MAMIIIFTIVIGALIGWLAGIFMKSKHGFWTNCLIGIIGSIVGSAIANALNIGDGGFASSIIIGVAGACIFIAAVRAIMGKKF